MDFGNGLAMQYFKFSYFIIIFAKLPVMTTITLQLPDNLAEQQYDALRFIAAKFYESGRLTLGQAAEMAGLSKRTFAELLGDYGVSIINYSVDDLKDELSKRARI